MSVVDFFPLTLTLASGMSPDMYIAMIATKLIPVPLPDPQTLMIVSFLTS